MSWEGKQGQHHKISQATLRVLVFILRATEIHWGLLSREVTWQVWPFVKIGLAEAWRMVLRTGVGSPKYIRSDLDKGKTKMCWHITSGPLQLELFVQHWFWDMSETVWGRWDKEACLLLPYVLLFGPQIIPWSTGKIHATQKTLSSLQGALRTIWQAQIPQAELLHMACWSCRP